MVSTYSSRLNWWSLLIIIYVSALIISFFASASNHRNSLRNAQWGATNKPTILYFGDPILDEPELLDSLSKSFNILHSVIEIGSFEDNALHAIKKLDSLNWAPNHVIGTGIGGSIAMHYMALTTDSLTSLTLINSNGIEELELLGGYHLNHTAYRIKRIWFGLLQYGVPHFDVVKEIPSKKFRVSIQIESDQRKIRPLLNTVTNPVLILHSEKAKINPEVSQEHHRLLPQSTLMWVESWKDEFSEIIHFYQQVETSEAQIRANVSPQAQAASLQAFDSANGIKAEGWMLALLMFIIILSTMVSEDLTCIGTGLMVARGLIGFVPGTIACLGGIFIGDILIFIAGRWLAGERLKKAPLKWFITEKDIQKSALWFEAKGPAIIIASRFIPGTRFPTYFTAGAIRANFYVFMLYFGIASVIWTPMLVGLATFLGQKMIHYFTLYQEYALVVLLGVLAILFLLFKILIPSLTYQGRRMLIGKWKRFVYWEYWSPFIVYAPVLVYSIFLWVKYRSITLVTLANPGMKDGGFVKESKSEILDSITSRPNIADYIVVEPSKKVDARLELITQFMKSQHLDFPIVLKPDVGERGKGVSIPKNDAELKIALLKNKERMLAQEYIGGEEFGVFYYRFPNDEQGQIFSITRKQYLSVTGDGKQTLEHLILQHPRAVCLAEKHFKEHIDNLYRIIPKDKLYKLVEVGTHARGAIFSDASYLKTEALEQEIDRISQSFDGFYFGRYDLKVPTETHLKEGNQLKILEVNGITSEATHIYDSKFTYIMGVRVLMHQWRLAYQIAAQVKQNNPTIDEPSLKYILQLIS